MATHSSILAWRIPWTEESSGLQAVVCGVTKCCWDTAELPMPVTELGTHKERSILADGTSE